MSEIREEWDGYGKGYISKKIILADGVIEGIKKLVEWIKRRCAALRQRKRS